MLTHKGYTPLYDYSNRDSLTYHFSIWDFGLNNYMKIQTNSFSVLGESNCLPIQLLLELICILNTELCDPNPFFQPCIPQNCPHYFVYVLVIFCLKIGSYVSGLRIVSLSCFCVCLYYEYIVLVIYAVTPTERSNWQKIFIHLGFPGDSVVKNLPANAGNRLDPWIAKIPWRRKWQPLWCSCLENPPDRGAWWATVQGVLKSQPRLNN